MRKSVLYMTVMANLWGENLTSLQYTGVHVTFDHNKTFYIERVEPFECMDIGITPKNLFGSGENNISAKCTHRVFTTLGSVQAMQIDPKIKTVGELEVLAFLKKQIQSPQRYILIDARKPQWYETLTIAGAQNLPYNEIAYDPDFAGEHERMLHLLHIRKTKTEYDFSQAKHALLFCNGAWCVQSVKAIRELVKLGYPKEKLLWYRGGIQDWLSMGFKGVKPSGSH